MWLVVIGFFTSLIGRFRSKDTEPSKNVFAAKVVTISLLAGLLLLFFIGIKSCNSSLERKRLEREANAVSGNIQNAESNVIEAEINANSAVNVRKEINANIANRKVNINKSKANINAIKTSTPKPINGSDLDKQAEELYP